MGAAPAVARRRVARRGRPVDRTRLLRAASLRSKAVQLVSSYSAVSERHNTLCIYHLALHLVCV